MAALKVGDAFPDDVVFTHIPAAGQCDIKACGVPQPYAASKEFKHKKAVLVAVPGAFTPTCQASHLPGYLASRDALRAKGVDCVVVIAYNDAYVMSAWGKAHGVTDDFVMLASDGDAKFSKSIGWTAGERTARYAIVVDHGKVVYASKEDDLQATAVSGAEAVLRNL